MQKNSSHNSYSVDLDTVGGNQKYFLKRKSHIHSHTNTLTINVKKENQFSPQHPELKREITNDPGKPSNLV